MWLKTKIFIFKSYLKLRVLLRRIFTMNHRTVKKKILAVESDRLVGLNMAPPPLEEQIFLASTFKVSTPTRQDIVAVTIRQSLSGFKNSGLNFKVVDASSAEYLETNRHIFERIPGLRIDYEVAKKSMPRVFVELLGEAKEKYCMCIFDDIPLVNLSPEYLQAACQLLEDYAGVVDAVSVWDVPSELSQGSREIIMHSHKDIQKELGKKLLGVVKYGNFSFVIAENFFYGFSLLNFMAPCHDYLRRLKWYMAHVSAKSPEHIEKASMWFRGPAYNYVAIPLEVFFLDIDYEHTESSIRAYYPKQKEYYQALKNGYNVVVK